MKSLKFYKILSLVLVILNIATLAFFYFSKPPHPPRPGEAHLANEIGLTGENRKIVDALEINHHLKKRKLMDKDFELHQKLFKELSDEQAANKLIEQINDNRAEIERMTYNFFSEVAAKCNEKQKEKLDEIISRSLRMITNQPRGKK